MNLTYLTKAGPHAKSHLEGLQKYQKTRKENTGSPQDNVGAVRRQLKQEGKQTGTLKLMSKESLMKGGPGPEP